MYIIQMSPVFRYPGFGFQMQCLNLSFKFCHVMYSNPFYTAHFISWETWQRTVFVSFGISVLLFKVSFFFFLFSFGLENNHPPVNKASMEVEICIMRNKTGLQPVSRPVDQFIILGGGGVGVQSPFDAIAVQTGISPLFMADAKEPPLISSDIHFWVL